MEGTIFDIQRFCINDGPGIRTTVFLKGCPLDCIWCHNPESKKFSPQLSFKENLCVYCAKCVSVCKSGVHKVCTENKTHIIDFDKCKFSEACTKVCPTNALSIYGRLVNADEVLEVVKKDEEYYKNSGGGLTISGGEPMSQFDFTYNLAKRAKEAGIHVAMETSGFGKIEYFEKILPYVDLFLYDYKATGNELHTKLTGVNREIIDSNLSLLLKSGAKIILRCPIIPHYNLSQDHLNAICTLGKENDNITRVELLPYHNLGAGKSKQIGENYDAQKASVPTDDEVDGWIKKLNSMGLDKVYKG